jgi:hypothetical protein
VALTRGFNTRGSEELVNTMLKIQVMSREFASLRLFSFVCIVYLNYVFSLPNLVDWLVDRIEI